jgi:NADPH:quinone reductase-like Zn-dependent oxidoreductase
MRVIWLLEHGGPEVLVPGAAPDPDPGPGQVVIDVALANITFVETQMRAGRGPLPVRLPMIPGNGVGGVVALIGAGVDDRLLGQRVVTSTGGSGGYAERVAVDVAAIFRVPEGLALDAALALLADGRTAAMLVDAARVRSGERVLVEAAAGGVGTLLVQLAKNAGATVVAAAGGDQKLDLARDLGADWTTDYRYEAWAERLRHDFGHVDVVFDGVGGAIGRAAFGLLKRGGRMLSFGLASGEWAAIQPDDAAERGVTLVETSTSPAALRRFTERALAAAAAGRLRAVVGQRFPLERAADAHAAIEARTTMGKTLLDVS